MIIIEEYINLRQKELMDEAARYRLASKVRTLPGRPNPIFAIVMTWIGSQMLKLGTWLTLRFGEKTIISQSGIVDNHIQGTP